jgi:DNA-binding PadR family transcriptional regulator
MKHIHDYIDSHQRRFARGEHGHRGHGRGGRGSRPLGTGDLRLVLLRLIAEQPRHGYEIIRAIEEKTGGAYSPSPGVIYPTLTMLAELGHVVVSETEGGRKLHSITAEG